MTVYLIPSVSDSLRGGLSCWAASGVAQMASPWQPHVREDTWPEGGTRQRGSPPLLPRKAWGPWATPQNADSRQQAGAHCLTPLESPVRSYPAPGQPQPQQLP